MTAKETETLKKLQKAMDVRNELLRHRIELDRAGKDTTEVDAEIDTLRSKIAKLRNRWESSLRHRKEKEAAISDFTPKQWERLKKESGGICSYCGKRSDDLTADHIIPLSRGGTHTLDNIVVVCRSCNSRKGERTLGEANMRVRPGIIKTGRGIRT
jgi:5-methylcytosine-specific restriction endonuclease McrA